MGQKVHPKGFRLGFTQRHLSCWYASPKEYSDYVVKDNEIRQKLNFEGISKVEIRRLPGQLRVWVYTSQYKKVLPIVEKIQKQTHYKVNVHQPNRSTSQLAVIVQGLACRGCLLSGVLISQ